MDDVCEALVRQETDDVYLAVQNRYGPKVAQALAEWGYWERSRRNVTDNSAKREYIARWCGCPPQGVI